MGNHGSGSGGNLPPEATDGSTSKSHHREQRALPHPSTDDSDLLGQAPIDDARGLLGRSGLFLCLLAVVIGVMGEAAAWCLFKLIGLFTNLVFNQTFSFAFVAPTTLHVGWWVLLIPVGGGLIVGLMARYGSEMIRGHGIPEAMASALFHDSKIPPRVAILKPLSAAVSIGTGCPFGAEGPIIATGAALGSIVGQVITVTKDRRRVLLAAGAAAGMSATFGAPLASVLMALELLLFEFQPIAILAVAIAAGVAGALRIFIMGGKPIFSMPPLPRPTLEPLMIYALIGIVCGIAAVLLTHGVYLVEDAFKKYSRLHWMWWPAIGGLAVGVCGLIFNPSMGVGYVNISAILDGKVGFEFAAMLVLTRIVSWTISLGSGTSGSTMAPLFNIGSALGAVLAISIVHFIPQAAGRCQSRQSTALPVGRQQVIARDDADNFRRVFAVHDDQAANAVANHHLIGASQQAVAVNDHRGSMDHLPQFGFRRNIRIDQIMVGQYPYEMFFRIHHGKTVIGFIFFIAGEFFTRFSTCVVGT